jgi:hypothetical protein
LSNLEEEENEGIFIKVGSQSPGLGGVDRRRGGGIGLGRAGHWLL